MYRYISIIVTASIPLLLIALLIWGCGDPPSTAVDIRFGSIQVDGRLLPDSSAADSIWILVDPDPDSIYTQVYFPNPHILTELPAGTHLLAVGTVARYESDTLAYYSVPRLVEVQPAQITTATFALTTNIPTAPREGYIAPDFQLYDLDSNLVSLSGLSGEIVLLYFFTST